MVRVPDPIAPIASVIGGGTARNAENEGGGRWKLAD